MVDAANNTQTTAYTTAPTTNVTVDTTAPTITLVTGIGSATRSVTPTIRISVNEAATLSYQNGCDSTTTTIAANTNTDITFNTLRVGFTYNCRIIATDAAGNPTTYNVNAFNIDQTATNSTNNNC